MPRPIRNPIVVESPRVVAGLEGTLFIPVGSAIMVSVVLVALHSSDKSTGSVYFLKMFLSCLPGLLTTFICLRYFNRKPPRYASDKWEGLVLGRICRVPRPEKHAHPFRARLKIHEANQGR